MRILHISDFHYTKSNDILDAISKDINSKIDLCLFTGDLVNKFAAPLPDAFDVLKQFNKEISCENYFITCGNHDINRSAIKASFKSFISNFNSEDEINNYVRDNEANDFIDNLTHINDYHSLLKAEYPESNVKELYAIHRIKISNQNIAIVDLNLSWCAFYSECLNKIIYPTYLIKEISKLIRHDDLKLLISHFPLFFLNTNCKKSVSDIIYKTFDCHFTGHSHEFEISNYHFSENGLFTCIAPSTMDKNNSNNLGYCIYEVDPAAYRIRVFNNIYHNTKFLQEQVSEYDIPTDEAKKNEIKLFEGIKNRLSIIEKRANNLFVPAFNKNSLCFSDIFTSPNIKTKGFNKQFSIDASNKISQKSNKVPIDELYCGKNFLVYGKEKSGKTVILYKILMELLSNFAQFRTIPIYIDLKDIYTKEGVQFNLLNEIQSQYSFSNTFIKNNLPLYSIKLLVDNFNYGHKSVNSKLFKFLSNVENCSYIITSTYFYDMPPINLDDLEYQTIYLHDISRTNMRELTNKWPIEKDLDKNEIFSKMISIFSQLNIHFNYWTVSMFLCVIERTENLRLHNNSELIDLYIENLLDKQTLSLTSTKTFSYDNLRSFLANLAHYLYSEKFNCNYCAKYAELVICYEKYRSNSPRVVTDVKVILDYILDKGIIYDMASDSYTFRLNGVFEYFLAYYMYKCPKFKYAIINNSATYLKFKNELEIYSGLQKDDFEFLLQIYYNTEDALKLLRDKYPEDIDYEEKIKEETDDAKKLLEFAADIKNQIVPISNETQDILYDELNPISTVDSEIHVKKEYNIREIDAGLYAEHLNILGRVLRNLDDIKGHDKDLLKQIFRFLIDQSCLTIFYTIQEYIEYISKNESNSKTLKEFAKFIGTFSPLLTHAFLFENVSHPTLSEIIEEEIATLKADPDRNQYKLFVLYFLLIESNIEIMHSKIPEIINLSKHWSIRQSIFFKLILLITFKCDKKPSLCKTLKQYIEQIHKKLYPGKDSKKQPRSNKDVVNRLIKEMQKSNKE